MPLVRTCAISPTPSGWKTTASPRSGSTTRPLATRGLRQFKQSPMLSVGAGIGSGFAHFQHESNWSSISSPHVWHFHIRFDACRGMQVFQRTETLAFSGFDTQKQIEAEYAE
jgi:hypothetical protein